MSCSSAVVLLTVLACLVLGGQAQSNSALRFPAFDNCRRNPKYSGTELVALPPEQGKDGVTNMCFKVKVKSGCQTETFTMKGKRIKSRCCNTSFAKIKFYVDPACRGQFGKADLIASRNTKAAAVFNKVVSPTWTRQLGFNEVKYTQFGPIPHDLVDGTTFCLRMLPGPCKLSDFTGIANPKSRARRVFQVAIYDRKVDNYECCPTFSFPLRA